MTQILLGTKFIFLSPSTIIVSSMHSFATDECRIPGGGYTLNAGAANIKAGVTISLQIINEAKIDEDRKR
ncbi:predicted protein [Sclerotinia sclerotiorum 1980 UF-70]|uniref:Uncharacterized protein n=1 Tax=Sclerotinia sclerotiorum (strain ATCC 18683 / 1980 / Ss-1) TaxID=665079 RepID=A7EM26_SCLS1|nr:predicted protein [Sclerotinia sclerotiorum 1980 UF-70]EDO03892.1 predicted protein [Sclerotinia sclerotiorum 1980 UF-70]